MTKSVIKPRIGVGSIDELRISKACILVALDGNSPSDIFDRLTILALIIEITRIAYIKNVNHRS